MRIGVRGHDYGTTTAAGLRGGFPRQASAACSLRFTRRLKACSRNMGG